MMPVLPSLPATATPLQPSGSLTIPIPPDWLSALPSGSLIQGVVQERDSAGLTTIATAQGKFSMFLGSPASPGAAISLQLQTSANQTLQAQLLSIERRPAAPGFSSAAVTLPPPAVNALPPPQAGEVTIATIIRTDLPAPQATAAPSQPAPQATAAPSQPAPQATAAPSQPAPQATAAPSQPAPQATAAPSQPAPQATAAPSQPAPQATAAPSQPAPQATAAPSQPAPQATAAPSQPAPQATAAPSQPAPQATAAPSQPAPQATAAPSQPAPQATAAPSQPAPQATAAPSQPAPQATAAPSQPAPQATAAPSQPAPQATAAPSQPAPQATAAPSQPAPQATAAPSQPAPQATAAPSQPAPQAIASAFKSLATPGLPRQPGDTVTVKLLAIALPASTPVIAGGGAAPPTLAPASSNTATITATVVANSANGQPIVIGGSTLMTLATGPLPPGSAIDMIALAPAQRPGAATAPGAFFPVYPSLPTLMAAAAESGSNVQNALSALLPKPGPALAGEILRFLNAARKGDLNSLIQNELRAALEKTAKGKSALRSLSQEFIQESRSNSEPARGEWRAFTLPMISQGAIEPVRLYLHGLKDDEAQGRKDARDHGQRFMIEIALTSLGPLQIDGLAKPAQLDIVLRTPQALPPEARQALTRFFGETLSARGLTGLLTFQVAPPVPVADIPSTRRASRSGILA